MSFHSFGTRKTHRPAPPPPPAAPSYWISPTGDDSKDGLSEANAKKTWAAYFKNPNPVLVAGDTLTLADGQYTVATSGTFVVDCTPTTGTGNNGTLALPITIKAKNERQAQILGSGTSHIMEFKGGASYYTIQGLQITGQDGTAGNWVHLFFHGAPGPPIVPQVGNTVQRCVFNHTIRNNANVDVNSQLIMLQYATNTLIEENEFYDYCNRAIQLYHSNYNEVRRNYLNTRGLNMWPNGLGTAYGDEQISNYPGSHNLYENNFIESATANQAGWPALPVNATSNEGDTINNRYFGNAVKNARQCATPNARGDTLAKMPQDTEFHDMVAIGGDGGAAGHQFWIQSVKNLTLDHFSFFNAYIAGRDTIQWQSYTAGSKGDSHVTFAISNGFCKGSGAGGNGISFQDPPGNSMTLAATVTNVWVNGTATAFTPAATTANTTYTSCATTDPGVGTCYLWVPDGAAAKGQATDGGDIGANILYQTINGVTYKDAAHRLWDPTTQAPLFAGATITGLNDVAGSSLFDMMSRFNPSGTALPAGY